MANTGPSASTLQLRVGDHGRDLDDAIRVGLETGHLQVDPDQVVAMLH